MVHNKIIQKFCEDFIYQDLSGMEMDFHGPLALSIF